MSEPLTVSSSRLYVDDARTAPLGWDVAKDYTSAIAALESKRYLEVSLDHDLGCFIAGREYTGYDILLWLVQRKMNGAFVPLTISIHSQNSVAVDAMQKVIARYF